MSRATDFANSLDEIDEIFEVEDEDSFLPEDYKVPTEEKYMKLKIGDNRFRILSSPIVGYIFWIEEKDDKGKLTRKPVRLRMNELQSRAKESPRRDEIKHFWAMVVYNYDSENISILEITQRSIQNTIKSLQSDPDWGSPKKYDLLITRTGEGLDTHYTVTPKPSSKIDDKITEKYNSMHINLEALFEGGDPYEY